MAFDKDLAKSIRTIEGALKAQKSAPARRAALGMGGISTAIGVIREFCKNWPKIKPVLEKAGAFLKKEGQDELARVLELVIRFFGTIAKVCPLIS